MANAQKSQIDLPINWDDTMNVDYSVIDFGGDSSLLAADPTNASNIVLKVIKTSGAQTWAGTVLGNDSLANDIPFSIGNTKMRAVVYSPDSGITVRLKVEDETNGAISVETDAFTTVANAWDTLTFDFTNNVVNTPVINYNNTYNKVAIFFDFGTLGSGKTYYVDLVEFVSSGKSPITLPISWDDSTNVDYTVIDFGGNVSDLAADPNNASNTVLRSRKDSAFSWAGTSFGNSLGAPIPFTAGNTKIKAAVYSPDTGIVVKLKVEDSTDPTKSVETDVTTTVANAWDTLTFDFSNHSPATSAINFTYNYDKMSVFYDFGVIGSGKNYYIDDVTFQTAPLKALISLPIDWDDSTNIDYTPVDFGGNASSLDKDPLDSTNTVLKSEKTSGAQTWAGTSFGNALAAPIPFQSGYTTIHAVVYSPDTGIVVKLKVEDSTDPTKSVETDVTTTVANAWDTLSFDMSNQSINTAAINFTTTYNKMSIFYDFGVMGSGKIYYVDYIAYEAAPAKKPISLPVNWEDSVTFDYKLIDFGGNSSSLAADPLNASNTVVRSEKTSGAQTWAGTTLGDSLSMPIPFSSGNTTLRAVVYSPDTGIVVKLKVEDYFNAGISVETDVTTTVANAWDTLSFDMSNQSSGTAAINFSNTYNKMSIFYDFGIMGAAKTYYVDHIEFLGAATTVQELEAVFNNFTLYPNPANNTLFIRTNELEEGARLDILNNLGQTVQTNFINNNNSRNPIDVSKLSNGIYFAVFQNGTTRETQRLVISK